MSDTSTTSPSTFEDQLLSLERIVRDLEDGQIGLEASLAQYEQGVKLLRQCQKIIREVEQKIELLTSVGPAGEAVTQDFREGEQTLAEKSAARGKRRSRATQSSAEMPPAADVDSGENLF